MSSIGAINTDKNAKTAIQYLFKEKYVRLKSVALESKDII